MNYIIFKADGSINEKNLAYYIQQGNTGVDTIFVSKADTEDEGSYTCQAFFKLPNGTTNTLAGVWTASVEYKTGVFANGWMITLTTNQTTYNGLLQMSVSLLLSSSNLLTYPVALVINETGYQPDDDSGVTIEEINSYLVQLQSYQLKYDLANVRGYNTLALATADLPNLADGQIVIVKTNPVKIYQVQAGTLNPLDSVGAYLPLAGGTMTGAISQPVAPVADTDLANKKYVDDEVAENTQDIADIIDGDSTVHTAYHAHMDVSGRNLVDLAKTSDLTDGTIIVKKAIQDASGNVITTTYATKVENATKQATSEKGQADGYASLDSSGKVPSTQLPAYVDDILEFANLASFPATGESGIIYVALDTNLTYRWSGSAYVEISPSLALGETSSTAYRGDKGKIAYDHSQLVDGSNPHGTTFSSLASKPTTLSGFGITDAVNSMISITYANLKTLRDSSQLIKGQQYRITDFVTTTAQTNTQSAGHAFDLIVVADDVNKLNENARACLHSGDTYFANSKLEAWQVWYCLDNDTTRFAWADEENGKGVIYRMIDEWNNDCPYDFKNIQFLRDTNYYYTFCVYDDADTEDIVDVSTIQNRFKNDENGYSAVFNNKINEWKNGPFDDIEGFYSYKSAKLNDIVFISKTSYDLFYGIRGNTFGNDCYSNTFGNYCFSNTFGNDCYSNTFGNDCSSNTFGNDCFSNTFGNGCSSNTFGNGCYNNTFGNDCFSNTFGNGCTYNTFGNGCYNNTFGNDCYYNTFGNGCTYNTFGNGCQSNTFGNGCSSNTFGNGCYNNTFGNDCYSNTFGNSCYSNKLVSNGAYKNDTQYIIFENGVSYIELQASDPTGSLQNIHISMGVVGASTQNMKVITEPRGLTHDVIYRATGSEDKVA